MTAYNPGSAAAMQNGCTCSPEKNFWGAGALINGGQNRHWTAAFGCPLHSSFQLMPAEEPVAPPPARKQPRNRRR
jgi:hypothetical protein